MAGFAKFSQADYNGEVGVVSVSCLEPTAANHDAQNTARLALFASIQAVTRGNSRDNAWGYQARIGNTLPTDAESQVEEKWLVRYEDATTRRVYTSEIACADLSVADILLENSDMWNPETAVWVTFRTDFEAFVRAPGTLNAVTILDVQHVGRTRKG